MTLVIDSRASALRKRWVSEWENRSSAQRTTSSHASHRSVPVVSAWESVCWSRVRNESVARPPVKEWIRAEVTCASASAHSTGHGSLATFLLPNEASAASERLTNFVKEQVRCFGFGTGIFRFLRAYETYN